MAQKPTSSSKLAELDVTQNTLPDEYKNRKPRRSMSHVRFILEQHSKKCGDDASKEPQEEFENTLAFAGASKFSSTAACDAARGAMPAKQQFAPNSARQSAEAAPANPDGFSNGSQSGSSAVSPNSTMAMQLNKNRFRSRFNVKGGSLPTVGFSIDIAATQKAMGTLNIDDDNNCAGMPGAADEPFLGPDFVPDMRPINSGGGDADRMSNKMSEHQLTVANADIASASGATGLLKGGNKQLYSRKVFAGGLPHDINGDEILESFRRFGPLEVDWPYKAEFKWNTPPRGFAFLLFHEENSVQQLVDSCFMERDKLYIHVSSPTEKDKPVCIRPWRLTDAEYVRDPTMPLDLRKTIFVGGTPRTMKANELATIMDRLYGGVVYASINIDSQYMYPKGAGRVVFHRHENFVSAVSTPSVQLKYGEYDTRVEVRPYLRDKQMCDVCQGKQNNGRFAPFFCADITCLKYICEICWPTVHSRPELKSHKPQVKGSERPRVLHNRWY